MKSFAAAIVLALAAAGIAAPADKRQQPTTELTFCKNVGCGGPKNDQYKATLEVDRAVEACRKFTIAFPKVDLRLTDITL